MESVNIIAEMNAVSDPDPAMLETIEEEFKDFKEAFDDSSMKLTAGPSHEQADRHQQATRQMVGWMDGWIDTDRRTDTNTGIDTGTDTYTNSQTVRQTGIQTDRQCIQTNRQTDRHTDITGQARPEREADRIGTGPGQDRDNTRTGQMGQT